MIFAGMLLDDSMAQKVTLPFINPEDEKQKKVDQVFDKIMVSRVKVFLNPESS